MASNYSSFVGGTSAFNAGRKPVVYSRNMQLKTTIAKSEIMTKKAGSFLTLPFIMK
jgi:hypothetical protein